MLGVIKNTTITNQIVCITPKANSQVEEILDFPPAGIILIEVSIHIHIGLNTIITHPL
ncbi:Uncharacterised protein [Chlamydia trachomatis]|nr:Uncharacterised protein [Chlamydia trachomatis]SYV90852.1 Uncharacterised protein [Mesomycoplasma hyorhinis]